MRWALRLGSVAGIGIFIHWTFLLLIGWVVFVNAGHGAAAATSAVLFTLAVFVCIVLHELGHALAALKFGVRTRDITLLPIGGVARLERIPEDPGQEFWIAIAGPAVNVVIAIALLAGLAVGGRIPGTADQIAAQLDPDLGGGPAAFLLRLFSVNVFLVVFNMIPAFPMDGGRVLRALLARTMDHARATRVAAWIGQAVAVVFAGLGLFGHQPMLLLIAVFVFLGAEAETQVAQVRAGLAGIPVRDAMITRFSTLSESDTLAAATDLLLAGSQTDFPVLSGDRIVGVLPRADLVRALAERGPGARVAEVMRPGCEPVADTERLAQVFERMQASGCPLVPVVRQGRLVGLVTPENVGEFLMIRSALAHPARGPEGGGDPTPAR